MYYLTALAYYCFLIPISLLPFSILYKISDGLSWLFFNGIGYRKKVVLSQLRKSFPEKSEAEIQTIARKFYTHLCDLMVESIKLFTLSEAEGRKRFVGINPEVCNKFYDNGQSVVIVAGHYNSFEYAAALFEFVVKHHSMGLYKPLHNAFFEKKMRASRGKFGSGLVSVPEFKAFLQNDLAKQRVAILFGMDQSPSNPDTAHWTTFLNQDTGVQFGSEKYAKDYNLPVVYICLKKPKRGYYEVHFEEITATPRETPHGYIVEKMTQLLEKDIVAAPEFWLWSHRRWKHERPT